MAHLQPLRLPSYRQQYCSLCIGYHRAIVWSDDDNCNEESSFGGGADEGGSPRRYVGDPGATTDDSVR